MRSYEDSLQRLGMTRDRHSGHPRPRLLAPSHRAAGRPRIFAQLATSGYRALAELKAAGLIGAIGAGINELGMMPRFIDLVDLDFFLVALRYTLGEHNALDVEIPKCAEKGIGFIIGGVFSSGIYATGPVPGAKYNYADASPAELDRARRIEAVCKRHGVPLPAAALQFPLHHPLVASVIPGGFRPEHVTTNIGYMRHEIPDALWGELKQEGLIRKDAPTP